MNKNIRKITWEQANELAVKLAKNIKESNIEVEGILCVIRGGMIPSYLVARELGLKQIKNICLQAYGNSRTKGEIRHITIEGVTDHLRHPDKWLIVDDIADSGTTIAWLRHQYPGIRSACLFSKHADRCDYCAELVDENAWIDFPWEHYED